jgi:stress response protein SCP2
MGIIKDSCYYNNVSAANGAVKHSGDNRSGEGDGDDEAIVIDLDAIPMDIKFIVFVVTANNDGGSFKHVETARAELRDMMSDGTKRVLSDISIGGGGNNSALILCALVKENFNWYCAEIGVTT